MSDDAAAPPQRIIKRTLTITTTETWIVTLGLPTEAVDRSTVSDTSPDISDQAIDRISQGDQEDQA